jgi:hypothetical protein
MSTLTSSFLIAYLNHAAGKTISTTTAASGYPASNLNKANLSSSWHSTLTSLTTQNLDADLGSSLPIDIIALIGSNLTDSATRTPLTSEASNFSSPEYNPGSANVFDMAYPSLVGDYTTYGRHLIILPPSTLNSRDVRTTLNNSGNPANFLSARVYWVGPIWQPLTSFPVKEGSFKLKHEPAGVPGLERGLTVLEVTFDVLTEAEGEALRSICLARLRTGRLFVVPRPDQPATWQREALYCTLKGLPTLTAWPQGGGLIYWKVTLEFKECED